MQLSYAVKLLCIAALVQVVTGSKEQLQNLTKNYDKQMRPLSGGRATNVSVQIAMIALGPISEKTLTMKSDIFLRQWWHDERLDIKDNVLNFGVDPTDYFWVPDTFISNSRKTESHKTFTKSVKTMIGPKDSVYASMRFTIVCHCQMDLRLFPMDIQTCSIDLESYAFSGNEISLYWKDINKVIDYPTDKLVTSGYEVLSIKGIREVTYYLNSPFPKLRALIKMKRSFPYFLYHVYIPGALLVALSFTTFFIPPTAVPARVTLIVTNFLSTMFIFGSTSSLIPKEPYITAMEVYSLINIVFIITVMIEYIFVLKLKTWKAKKLPTLKRILRRDDDIELEHQSRHLNSNGTDVDTPKQEKKPAGNGHLLDTIARLLFPVVYVIFLIVYFATYRAE